MKKYLYIENSTKPAPEVHESLADVHLDNCSIPCIESAMKMGYDVYMGVNRAHAESLQCCYPVKFYNANIYRSLLDLPGNLRAYQNLMKLLREEKIDVIHCNTPIGGVLGRLCGRKAGVGKIIYTAHGFHFYRGAPFLNNTVFKWAEMWLAHCTDAVITMNREDYAAAQRFKLKRSGSVYYIPGAGIDTDGYGINGAARNRVRSSLGLKDGDVMAISIGDLIPRKNYGVSIRALAQTSYKGLHFFICGTGGKKEALLRLARKLKVEERVHFLGYRKDITDLLGAADIFFFTSLQEGLPRSLMEAMASGLPCIVSEIRGNTDLIRDGEGGYLCGPLDVVGFARALDRLAGDGKLRESMGIKNLDAVKNFDVKLVKAEMAEMYRKILA
jgi:glycosyltransferase involved in cell wall biosynthesis